MIISESTSCYKETKRGCGDRENLGGESFYIK